MTKHKHVKPTPPPTAVPPPKTLKEATAQLGSTEDTEDDTITVTFLGPKGAASARK